MAGWMDKYAIAPGVKPGRYAIIGFGEVDLREMPDEVAERLYAAGHTLIVLKANEVPDATVVEIPEEKTFKPISKKNITNE